MFRCIFIVFATLALASRSRAQGTEDFELPPINYSSTQPTDIISHLQARLASGALKFSGNDKEIVQALLRELNIPAESQLLVFSKTSFQAKRIGPDCPRALYFSDTCYVGWVPGGLIEVASIDPNLGPVFYSFDPRAEPDSAHRFVRDADCLRCHGGTFVSHIPAVFARSLFADDEGQPLLRQGTEIVDFRTPFQERWGGWYVTGTHGKALHRGNLFAHENDSTLVADFAHGANVTNLSSFFSTDKYLAGTSDIVALLVFEHQLAMHNAITRAAFNCRRMLNYQKGLQQAFKEPITDEPTYDSVKTVFDSSTRDLLNCLLFKDEATLPDAIAGSPQFQKVFQSSAQHAPSGSSLKDLDLKGHLLQNRCSYLIYSESFLRLPLSLKRRVYARLLRVLQPASNDSTYSYIGTEERARILEILHTTHPDFQQL